ncbi:MAG: anthranilate synthase component II [Thermoplasmata archaeon]
MKIVLIDHEDSFVYNLDQALRAGGATVRCVRYNVGFPSLRREDPDAVVFSPGPGHPRDRGVTGLARQVLERYGRERPILGVCLGHQLIAEHYGARVVRGTPVHGETARVRHQSVPLFRGVPNPFRAARYHSLVVDRASLPAVLRPTAVALDGTLMALEHRTDPVRGVQFHPESFLTEGGRRLIDNFLAEVRR